MGRVSVLMIVRGQGALLAIHPARVAVSIVLFLPDRHAVLHLIDDVAAGGERLAPVHRAHAHPDGHVAEIERAHAMDAERALHGEACAGLGEDTLALLDRESLESLVFEARDLASF